MALLIGWVAVSLIFFISLAIIAGRPAPRIPEELAQQVLDEQEHSEDTRAVRFG